MTVIVVYLGLMLVVLLTGYEVTLINSGLFVVAVLINYLRERAKNSAEYWRGMYEHKVKGGCEDPPKDQFGDPPWIRDIGGPIG